MNPRETLHQAIEVFARGFSFTRSFTHPYVPERIGPVWVVRDAPCDAGIRRNEEWIASGVSAAEMDGWAREHARGRFAICAILPKGEDEEALRESFKSRGYRLMTTEALMVRELGRIPQVSAPVRIARVTTQAMADRLLRAARQRLILSEHLKSTGTARLRVYVALSEEQIVGWVRSVAVGDATWVASMYVVPAFRRRGIGKAMLATMLRADRVAGARQSVLLASHAGAKLYSVFGYETIATLFLFTPRKRGTPVVGP